MGVGGVRVVGDVGLPFDACVREHQLRDVVELAHACPQTSIVLDHLGKPPVAAGGSALWRRGFAQLADLGNVWCKLSGLVTEADWARWTEADLAPYLAEALRRFGPARLLFGSDWPVITPDRWLSDFAKLEIRDEVRPKVLKANARKLLNL